MEQVKRILAPVIVAVMSVAVFGCDCKDDDELRRLERERQNQKVAPAGPQ